MKTFARASKNNKLSQVELKMLFFISKAKIFGWCEVQNQPEVYQNPCPMCCNEQAARTPCIVFKNRFNTNSNKGKCSAV